MTQLFPDLPEPRRTLAIAAHTKLHALWTKSEGPKYDKSEWRDLEKAIAQLAVAADGDDPRGAMSLVRLRRQVRQELLSDAGAASTRLHACATLVLAEAAQAADLHSPINSAHEGYAVILESSRNSGRKSRKAATSPGTYIGCSRKPPRWVP